MKLRLVEEYDAPHDRTRYYVERHEGGWFDDWETVDCYSTRQDAEETFNRLKKSGGEYVVRTVLAEWPSKS